MVSLKLKARLMDVVANMPVVILNLEDAKELGVYPGDRVLLRFSSTSIIASLDTTRKYVAKGEIGIYRDAQVHGIKNKSPVFVSPTARPRSVEYIIKKMRGAELKKSEIYEIIGDIHNDRLSDSELGAFLTAVYIRGYTDSEVADVTRAMVEKGNSISWGNKIVVDKHSIGGVPGNRTTPVVVPILAAAGLTVPKTSSRAITSPAGTADTMEVFCNVSFSIPEIKRIVNKTGACMVWGGALTLAPVDDKFIRIEHALSIDPEGQVLASVMSKKNAVGSKYVLIDIPLGDEAKVERMKAAEQLAGKFKNLGRRLGMSVECAITEGAQPIGNGIGPVLEAIDIVEVLKGRGPPDLREKSLELAGMLLQMTKKGSRKTAEKILDSGKAFAKFREIVRAQGGSADKDFRKMLGRYTRDIISRRPGTILRIANEEISKVSRIAGAPNDKGAGVYLHFKNGGKVNVRDALFTIYAEKEYKLEEAIDAAKKLAPVHVGNENEMVEEVI